MAGVSPRPRPGAASATRPRHGLVVGKFYPPHAGHHLLVRTAAATCERVTVLVMAGSAQSIPIALRVQWIREEHRTRRNVTVIGTVDDNPYDYASDAAWRAHLGVMQRALRWVTDAPVDAVFTSEAYGDELARRLGARHVCVDQDRGLRSISGTRVRADPVGTWEHLAPGVRAWFAKRVVVVGAERTGRTTLAEDLAEALRVRGGPFGLTRAVPDCATQLGADLLARARAQAQLGAHEDGASPAPSSEHGYAIATEQNRLEDDAARSGGPVLVCDSDAFAAAVWHERRAGRRSEEVESLARAHPLYLLAHPEDVPFRDDAVRAAERAWMTRLLTERLEATGRRWCCIRGDREARLATALAAVDALLGDGWRLAPPPG
jgi:HTH-type transcriptional regulator, transcriptional repressor of NAD biosynthesis genes